MVKYKRSFKIINHTFIQFFSQIIIIRTALVILLQIMLIKK